MRPLLLIVLILLAYSCHHENVETPAPQPKNEYEVYYRELTDKKSWVMNRGNLVFDKTEVLLIDTSNKTGFEFKDTMKVTDMPAIVQNHMRTMEEHPNISYLKDVGFIKLVKKQIDNGEKYLVMSNDSSLIFIYKIVEDTTVYSFSCELYGSHCTDSTRSNYSFHVKDGKPFTFRKYP